MAVSKALTSTSAFLENYWSRNQVYRTVQFASVMVAGVIERYHQNTAGKFLRVATAISDMRVLLRLMDDIPALVFTLRSWNSCKTSRNDKAFVSNLVEFVNALSGQLYYPLEHFAWAADNSLIPVPSTPFWTAGTLLWGLSLVISCLQATWNLIRINRELLKLTSNSNSRKKVTFEDEAYESESKPIPSLKNQRLVAALTVVASLSDLMNAIHWLPEGILWAGKLPLSLVGLFGTISSLIGLYKIMPNMFP